MSIWNPWHGCTKISPGCKHCYVYRRDAEIGKDSTVLQKNAAFDLPVSKNRKGGCRMLPDGDFVYTCLSSDFFHPDADAWRTEIWAMIKARQDLSFFIITKRPERFYVSLPSDWGEGYANVHLSCTCENQEWADRRLPDFLQLPVRHRYINLEPLLEAVNLEPYLACGHKRILEVSCGGESGDEARLCDYAWIMSLREQCLKYRVSFSFHQTGANFRYNNRIYHIKRKYQHWQAKKAGIDYQNPEKILPKRGQQLFDFG